MCKNCHIHHIEFTEKEPRKHGYERKSTESTVEQCGRFSCEYDIRTKILYTI